MAIINKGMSRRSFLGLTGSVAAVAGLGLTGCGGSSSDEGSASGSTDSANRGGGRDHRLVPLTLRPASIPPAPAPLWAWVLTGTSSRASTASITTTTAPSTSSPPTIPSLWTTPLSRSPSARRQVLRWHRGHR